MRSRIFFKAIVSMIFLLSMLLFTNLKAIAFESSLSAIDVKQNNNGSYNIQLKLDKAVDVKKIFNGNDNLTIMLSSAIPSDSMEIIYDNTSDINNVIVQKKNDNNTLILFQGNNIKNSDITIKELSTGLIKNIDLNNPSFLFIPHKKLLSYSILSFILMFIVLLNLRPKEKRYYSNNSYNTIKSKADTLRKKNLIQEKRIPSINYNIKNGFNSSNIYASVPKEFVINKYQAEEMENIRKAG